MKRLEHKVAIVTGAARGLGKATALRFCKEGARVALWDIQADAVQAAAEELRLLGFECSAHAVNVADFDAVATEVAAVKDLYGRIDILINNAGITRDATLLKMTKEQWQAVIDVNLTGVFTCAKHVATVMAEQGYGRIVNTSSVVGLYGNFGQSNYVAAKSGIIGLTKVWAKELGRKGITVNAVAPGFTATEMLETVPEKVLDAIKEKTPLQRLGSAEDIVQAYLYLASDEASFVTGVTLSVDGGLVV